MIDLNLSVNMDKLASILLITASVPLLRLGISLLHLVFLSTMVIRLVPFAPDNISKSASKRPNSDRLFMCSGLVEIGLRPIIVKQTYK